MVNFEKFFSKISTLLPKIKSLDLKCFFNNLMKPFYSVRGKGLRAGDKDVVPLCSECHRELHLNGNEEKYSQWKFNFN